MSLSTTISRWLFQLDYPEAIPIRLNQRRIFILPTRLGLFYALMITVMYLGAVNYNLGLGHALVYLLVSLGGVAMLHTFLSLHRLEIRPGRGEPTFVGQSARFEILVKNPDVVRRPAIRLQAPDALGAMADLPAQGSASLAIFCEARHRGWMSPPRLTLESRFPLGLFRAWSHPRPPLRVLVYPKPTGGPLPPPIAVSHPGAGGQSSGDEDFSGLRARQDADPLRHVAWKAWAKGSEEAPLYIKQFSGGLNHELWLRLDDLSPAQDLEQRLSILTGWVLAAESTGQAYGLDLGVQRLLPGNGPLHRNRCLETLALHGSGDHVSTSPNA